MAPLCTCNIFVIIHSCKLIPFLIFFLCLFFLFFYVTPLFFIGPAGQLGSSVSCTKETKWSRGRAVMSNSSYSVTYRPAVVLGSLMETMDGFERSGALWSPSLIEFPGSRLQRWGCLWELWVRGRAARTLLCVDLSQTGGVEWKGLTVETEKEGKAGEAYCGALWMQRWHSITKRPACLHLLQIFSQFTSPTFKWNVLVERSDNVLFQPTASVLALFVSCWWKTTVGTASSLFALLAASL